MVPCRLFFRGWAPLEALETYVATFWLAREGELPDETKNRGVRRVVFRLADAAGLDEHDDEGGPWEPAILARWLILGPGMQGFRAHFGV
jgi:hypothetical protein